jgi:hypothetical protein
MCFSFMIVNLILVEGYLHDPRLLGLSTLEQVMSVLIIFGTVQPFPSVVCFSAVAIAYSLSCSS